MTIIGMHPQADVLGLLLSLVEIELCQGKSGDRKVYAAEGSRAHGNAIQNSPKFKIAKLYT